jgi:hypothetical protein
MVLNVFLDVRFREDNSPTDAAKRNPTLLHKSSQQPDCEHRVCLHGLVDSEVPAPTAGLPCPLAPGAASSMP